MLLLDQGLESRVRLLPGPAPRVGARCGLRGWLRCRHVFFSKDKASPKACRMLSHILLCLRGGDDKRDSGMATQSALYGSSASRRPSPMKLMAMTVIKIIKPGKMAVQGARVMSS
jgi:hypothetical protein